ncbi:uncharacterized protein LOC111706215 isoform X3 [Eurytemora carolleeae]|uniref:uncharacterized protein LOC111706215 isoform X3 n=1 Tax=Eurytemora carolleeae TaxID=1294199 RepID=UPI000C75D481|nr:uncharacterized protein LOC111706215 isoform X3 [Eurytemora carolleeae]|eukprot:XP_023334794.1 uncharacterized protein LOC111706215 isoform X3 [Eurytemora affinis]
MVLTTAATVLGVIVLRLHHQGRRGIPVPNYLRTVARWMAFFSYSSYPPIEKQLENLNKGTYSLPCEDLQPFWNFDDFNDIENRSVAPDDYCYNIKDYDHMFPKKKSPIFRQRPWFNHKLLSTTTTKPIKTKLTTPNNISTTAQHHQLQDIPHLNTKPVVKKIVKNGKPVFSPKGSQKLRKAKLYSSKDNISKKDFYNETVNQNSVVIQIEDGETDTLLGPNPLSRDLLYPEPKRDLPYAEPMLDLPYPVSPSPTPDTRVKVLWRKAASSEKEKKKEVSPKPELSGAWKDLTNKMMEERWKAEERKEIIGEEWRKISRIFDRFLLIVFVIMSLINTIWCIFTSPHFPDSETDDEDIPDFK